MVKKFFLLFFLLVSSGCFFNFQFKTNRALLSEYKYVKTSKDFKLYYNVNGYGDKKTLDIVLKNSRNFVMSNLKLHFVFKKRDFYYYVNRLKSGHIKKYLLHVGDAKSIIIEYEYQIGYEDKFLKPSRSEYGIENEDYYKQTGIITLSIR